MEKRPARLLSTTLGWLFDRTHDYKGARTILKPATSNLPRDELGRYPKASMMTEAVFFASSRNISNQLNSESGAEVRSPGRSPEFSVPAAEATANHLRKTKNHVVISFGTKYPMQEIG